MVGSYPSLLVSAPTVVAIVAIAKIELSGLKTLWVGLGGGAVHHQHDVRDGLWLALCAGVLLLGFWIFRVSPPWVRLTADNYATRLVEAIDDLHHDHSKAKAKTADKIRKPRASKTKT